jgi:hypothetical protein
VTFEKTCFVSPQDILSVRIQCAKCGSANIVPLAKLGRIGNALASNCIHCGEPSGIGMGTRELEELVVFSDILGRLAGSLKGRNVKYSFQIECPKES